MSEQAINPPIKSGWRGHINGHVEHTDSHVRVGHIVLTLDYATAYALCNLLGDEAIERSCALEKDQAQSMSNLGASIGRLIDHHSANNGGRQILK